jgi:hypothetical protein
VPLVIEPPSESPRTWTRTWEAKQWRGSREELIATAQAALDEMAARGEKNVYELVVVHFADDSGQEFRSVQAWRDRSPELAPEEIVGLHISLDGDATRVGLEADRDKGLKVTAEGSEAFAIGIAATLKSRLSGGADAGAQVAAEMPLPRSFRIASGVLAIIAAALAISVYLLLGKLVPSLLVGLFVWVIGLMGAAVDGVRAMERNQPPGFVLVAEGDQFPDEAEDRGGPIWTAKAWFDRHPAIRWGGTLILGAILGALASKAL